MLNSETKDMQSLAVAYSELCKTYNEIRQFRAKLLGFLPLVSGGGIFLLLQYGTSVNLLPIGLFGVLVTVGLWLYEKHNMERCRELIRRGAEWEKELTNNHGGQFYDHPVRQQPGKLSFVEKAAGFVYGSVLFGWIYIISVGLLEFLM